MTDRGRLVRAGRVVLRDTRRLTLAGCAGLLLAVAFAAPLPHDEVLDSAGVSLAFFATLLTGEAVIFALSFSASSAWPSFREIDSHIAFRDWVVTGWLGAMLTATGLLVGVDVPATYGVLLFLLADVLGMFSFVRLIGLASAGGRKQMLGRTLGRALARAPGSAVTMRRRPPGNTVVAAYLSQLDQAAAASDTGQVRDLAEQLAEVAAARAGPAGRPGVLALHLEVTHRVARAALLGQLDPVAAASSAGLLTGSLLTHLSVPDPPGDGRLWPGQAAAVLGQAGRYLAWLASTSLVLSVREVTSASAARELVAFSVGARQQVLRAADPDPIGASAAELGTPLDGPAQVLAWLADFTEFHGPHQAAAMYPVYEILTGTKFLGNYWDGDSVLSGLREALYSAGRVQGTAADASRAAFGSAAGFDLTWTLISVGALATLRDPRLGHPPELVRPEFTPDPQLLGAYLRTFASHRYFSTASQAMTALTRLVGHVSAPGALWQQVQSVTATAGWAAPTPVTEPSRRLSACVLTIASRLAPLAPGDSDRQLLDFLTRLPPAVLEATARLAARVLPAAGDTSGSEAARVIAGQLRVLQLVGTHRAGAW